MNLRAPGKNQYSHKGMSSEAPPLSGSREAIIKADGRGEYGELVVSRPEKPKISRNDWSHQDRGILRASFVYRQADRA